MTTANPLEPTGDFLLHGNALWRELDSDEAETFRQWARDNWTPYTTPNPTWHPSVRDEWARLDNKHNDQNA